MDALDPELVAIAIDFPLDQWPGNCYGVAHAMLHRRIVQGKLRYGHWLGPVADGSLFSYRLGSIIRHGWIETDTGVIDPTRWVFEGASPYIYDGPEDHYDVGGDNWRLESQRPSPEPEGRAIILELDNDTALVVSSMVGVAVSDLRLSHAFWLANLSRKSLGAFMIPIYRALIGAGLKALIPIDNLHVYEKLTR